MNDKAEHDLDSAFSDDEHKHLHLGIGEQLGLWGALLWLMLAAFVGSGVMLTWLWRLVGRMWS